MDKVEYSLYQNYSADMIETAVLDLFLQRDIAVLLVNKRGMGASEGNWYKNDFQGRADDLYAAISTLHNHPAIDSDQIGIVGHSQGGWIVQLAAAEHPDIAFFISLAGPTTLYQIQGLDMYTHIYPSFFSSWYNLRGYKQTGCFLGHELIKIMGQQLDLREIALLENVGDQLRPLLTEIAS